jgi:hypothetical protein
MLLILFKIMRQSQDQEQDSDCYSPTVSYQYSNASLNSDADLNPEAEEFNLMENRASVKRSSARNTVDLQTLNKLFC